MIKVNYTELDGPAGPTCRLEASGHAGYAPAGQDIVCAGASTLMQTLCALLAGEEGTVAQMDANMGDDKNTLSIRGLDVGSYYVKETKTPSGYYAPKGIFKLDLTAERDARESLVKDLASGGFTETKEADRALIQKKSLNAEKNRFEADLLNSSTPVLPTTGGVGTVMFTVIGLLCMGAALWFFLFARRRREDEQEQNKTTL